MARADAIRKGIGSFRGVPFKLDQQSSDHGRRGQLHEYPLRDKPFFEDLGRKARQFSLEVFVVGDDWTAQRDALVTACEAKGAGRLIHPSYGEVDAQCIGCRVAEKTGELGAARFTLTFVEAGDVAFSATAVKSTGDQVQVKADALSASSQGSFARSFSVARRPDFVAAAAKGDLSTVLTGLQGSVAGVRADALSAFAWVGVLSTMKSNIVGLISAPASLASQLVAQIRGISFLGDLNLFGSWTSLLGSLRGPGSPSTASLTRVRQTQLQIASIGPGFTSSPATTPSRIQQSANQTALLGLTRQTALGEAAQAAAATSFTTRSDATSARDQLATALDAELQRTTDDDVFQKLSALRIAVVRHLTDGAVDLPRLVTVTSPTSLPALVLAHRLYNDPTRAPEIVDRNRVRHPLFVPGGRPIDVLSADA